MSRLIPMIRRFPAVMARVGLVSSLLGAAMTVQGATYARLDTTNKLDSAGAWLPAGGPPGTNDIAKWDSTVATAANCTNGPTANFKMAWLGILYGTGNPVANVSIPVSGTSTLTLGSEGIKWAPAGGMRNLTIACGVILTNSQSWTAGAGLIVSNTGALTLTNKNLTIDGAGTVSITNVITGGGTITMNNASGTLLLSGPNTTSFFGPITNNAGLLRIGHIAALGSAAGATTIAAGGMLDLNGQAVAILEPLFLSGEGLSASGAVINASATAASVGAGIITLQGDARIGGTGAITLSGNLTNAAYTLTKAGTNTLVLSGSSGTYSQQVAVAGGILRATTVTALGATNGGVTVSSDASLDIQAAVGGEPVSVAGVGVGTNGALQNSSATAASLAGPVTLTGNTSIGVLNTANLALQGQITGGFAVTKVGAGAGRLVFTSAANNYSGGTTISNGVLAASNSCLPSAGGLVINGGTLAAFECMDTPFNRSIGAGAGNVSIPGGVSGFNGGGTNNVVNLGPGTALTWGDAAFNPSTFVLNSASAMFPINFTNAINLGSSVRKVQVDHTNRSATMSGNLTGTGGLEKLGVGTLVLSGNNSYSGVTRVLGGGLTLGSANALPGGIDVNGGGSALVLSGVLQLGSSDFKRGLGTDTNQVQWGPVSAGFAATNADRIVNLGGSSDPVTWNVGGFVSNGCALILGSTMGNKTVDFQNPISLGFGNDKTVQVDNGGAAIDGVLSGVLSQGSLVKSGAGTLFLSAANTYAGPTTLTNGVLLVKNLANGSVASAIGASDSSLTNLVALANSTLQYGGNTVAIDRNFTIAAGQALTIDVTNALTTLTLNGTNSATTGLLTKSGAGTLKLNAALNHTGTNTIAAGRLQYGIDNALSSGGLTVNGAGAVLDLGSYTDAVGIVTLTSGSILGDGTLASSGNFIFNSTGASTCSVELAGAGVLTNSGAAVKSIQNAANTFSGKVFMNGGAVEIVKLANVGEASSLGQPGSSANGVISIGSVAVAGILRYAGATDSTSDREINLPGTTGAATLDVSGPGSLALASNVTATGAGSKTLTLTGSGAGQGAIRGVIQNNSAANRTHLAKAGTGLWVLAGTNTYSGLTTISAGTLSVSNIANGGVACNIGMADSGATNLVLGGGSLSFTALPGEYSTDRGFTLTNNSRSEIDITNALATLIILGTNTATTGSLIKDGAGTLTLGGNYLHTGATIVSNGTLKVTGTLAGAGPVMVSGGTLSGDGACAGAVTNYAGGSLAPGLKGTPGGTLQVGGLTLNAGSTNVFELSASPASNDQIDVTGGLTVNGGDVVLADVEGHPWEVSRVYNLIHFAGALTGDPASLVVKNPGVGKTYTLFVEDNWIKVRVGPPGIMLLFR